MDSGAKYKYENYKNIGGKKSTGCIYDLGVKKGLLK